MQRYRFRAFQRREDIDEAFFARRIGRARDLRSALGFGASFRAVFSEGDGLPGLIVDKLLVEPEASEDDGEVPDEDGVLPDADDTSAKKPARAKR